MADVKIWLIFRKYINNLFKIKLISKTIAFEILMFCVMTANISKLLIIQIKQ